MTTDRDMYKAHYYVVHKYGSHRSTVATRSASAVA
jgi:hypothetical protein